MTDSTPIVRADEIFAIDKSIRWAGLVTSKGEVVLNKMRPGVQSYSPSTVDEDLLKLGPLTLLGVEERYSQYLQGVQEIIVHYGVTISVYARLGSQVIAISIEEGHDEVVSKVRDWLRRKKRELARTVDRQ